MILGQDIRVFVNSDSTNKTVNSKAFILVEQLNAFPVLAFKTATTNLELFDSEWNSKLCEEISTDDIKISVNTVLDDESEAVMQEAFSDSELMQVKIEVSDEVNTYYYILNGYISNVSNSGDKDKVHVSTYTFSPDELVGNGYYITPDYLVEGDGGVLSNGGTIPTPLGTNQTGNSFIKVDSTESVTGTELLGIVNIDNQDHTALTITKSGSLHAYVENTSDSAELYTTKNKPTSSDVGTYDTATIDSKISTVSDEIDSLTVNGYKITDAPVLNANDVSALPITGGTLTGALEVLGSANIITMKNTEEGDSNFISGVGHDGAERWYIGNTYNSNNVFISNDIAENSIELVSDGSIKLSTGELFTFNTDGTFEPASYENFDSRYVPSTATINGYLVNTNPVLVAGDVGTYTKEEINQIIAGETVIGVTSINGKMGDVVLDYDDVNAVSDLCTVNGKLLSSNAVLTFSDVNAVSDVCTVNGKLLSSNAVLTASDVSALPLSGGEIDGNLGVDGFLNVLGTSEFHDQIYRTGPASITMYDGNNILPYSTSTVWCKIMQLYMPQSSATAVLKIYGGEGFNGLPTNNDIQTIVLRTGNATVAVNENGRIGVSLYKTAGDGIGAILDVSVVESSDSTYDVYAQINAYTSNGFCELLVSNNVQNISFPRELYGDDGTVAPDTNMTTTIYHTGYWSDDNPTMTVQDLYANGDGRFTNLNIANNVATPTISIGNMNSLPSLIIGDSDTGFGNGGDGILLMFANAVNVMTAQSSVVEFHIPLATDGTLEGWGGVFDDGQRVYSPINPPPASSTTTAALGTNGWWKDNSTGRITQWGYSAVGGSGHVIYFPVAFPSACVNVQCTHQRGGAASNCSSVSGYTTTTATIDDDNSAGAVFWFAIGY